MTAVEISGGLRLAGLSVDAEYQRDRRAGPKILWSRTDCMSPVKPLRIKASVEAGYMLWRNHLEATARSTPWTVTRSPKPWQRASVGMNWYVNGHALKFSVMHRESFNTNGRRQRPVPRHLPSIPLRLLAVT